MPRLARHSHALDWSGSAISACAAAVAWPLPPELAHALDHGTVDEIDEQLTALERAMPPSVARTIAARSTPAARARTALILFREPARRRVL